MNTAIALTGAEVSVVASALHNQWEHLSRLRAAAERRLAEGTLSDDWAYTACREERGLAALDAVVAKLPEWVSLYMTRMAKP